MHTFNTLSKPTVVLVQGSALGGGVGLVACADIAIAAEKARFSLSETRLGLIPSVISPYVIDAIGARAARRYFLTAERFDAHEALRIGLIHEVVSTDALPAALENVLAVLRQCGPNAKAAAKEMIALVQRSPRDDALRRTTAERIAEIRASDEGREGVSAFLEKRSPAWYQE
ncbi:MAG: enoyl-CoA hydratase-related protein, partial [Gammaproteobacteria bacterium]|nr:enoyl-CoA hydratase-related protein [Gammaproteobacteria bacterium]